MQKKIVEGQVLVLSGSVDEQVYSLRHRACCVGRDDVNFVFDEGEIGEETITTNIVNS